jgi:hypothetical protein
MIEKYCWLVADKPSERGAAKPQPEVAAESGTRSCANCGSRMLSDFTAFVSFLFF